MHLLPQTKSIVSLLVIVLTALLLISCSKGDETVSAEELTTQGVALLTTSSGDVTLLRAALDAFTAALEDDPSYQPALANKLSTELALGDFSSAYESVERLIGLSGNSQYHVLACAIKEVSKLNPVSTFPMCYEAAASAMEEQLGDAAVNDANYLIALKLAGAENFETAAAEFLDATSSEAQKEIYEFMFFEDSREDTLKGLLPAGF